MVQKVLASGGQAVTGGVKRLHLMLHSTGGGVADGILLHNYLRNLPLELITYNGGSVASIAVLIYLAGKVRKVSKSATFMVHKSTQSLNIPATVEQLKQSVDALQVEDSRSEAILREYVHLSPEQWQVHERGALTLTAEESVKVGLAHEMADFTPPAGGPLVNL